MKGKISPDFLQKVKDGVNIVEIVGEHVVLRKSGANFTGLCPFHSERSPSFSVNEQKQLYHCYGCKKGGDLVSFVMEMNGISFAEAVEDLADRAKVPLPSEWVYGGGASGSDPEAQKKNEAFRERVGKSYRLNYFVSFFFQKQLKAQTSGAQVGRDYLKKRGLIDEQLRDFHVGYAPEGWEGLAAYLQQAKAPLEIAAELGLIRPSKKADGTGFFDQFRGRVMFPIIDLRGRVSGFGGRSLPPQNDPPKYLNSSDSVTFQKSKVLYGLYQAQKHIREKGEAILVEGYFDVIGMHAGGFENTVATCGTALTSEHLTMLRRLCDKIIVLFDSDEAGITATERAMELGLERGVVLYGANLPPGLDSDEIIFDQKTGERTRDGRERMREILAQAKPLLDDRIEKEMKEGLKGAEAKTKAIRTVSAWLSKFQDPVGKEVRLQAIEEKWGVSRELFQKAVDGERRLSGSGQNSNQHSNQSPQSPRGFEQKNSPQNAGYGYNQNRNFNPHQGMGSNSGFQSNQGFQGAPRRPQAGPPRPVNPANRAAAASRPLKPSQAEILVFQAFFDDLQLKQLNDASSKMPPEASWGDLFDYPPMKEWVTRMTSDPTLLPKMREAPESVITPETDPILRSLITEALVATGNFDSTAERIRETNTNVAILRRISQIWARFSQQLKTAMTAAELSQDATLQAKLMQEYLDVQRKMKEFNLFYDQGE